MKLGKLGVWAGLDGMTAADAQAFARRLEKRGYTALWTPESRGRNARVNAACLLAGTSSLGIATGSPTSMPVTPWRRRMHSAVE
jgi:alkanesulfonate monooxygenase SsuD/methylene tetrahydromethanopterin reductase-like flavin-dependent oxidoreductase (luciferase family)